ncbi:unnamed protein product [Brassicogethes aeneus]|uniref:BHLH domain-containing protein n=1 Tax=Brassicogethes aeneus TaxID=1431903 RepID=A0A9P0FLZ6_BRAAE|nr:unnamed protein product [Brassicogethes aeneus]
MDLLDPLDDSGDVIETKVIINDIEKHGMDSDDEQVNHLSPQTLLETHDSDVHYAVKGSEGLITYRVLQVEDGGAENGVQQIVSNGSNFNNAGVITSNLNGQLYVISNHEVFSQQSRPIAPAIAPRCNLVDPLCTNIKKKDERRRATHNEVERRRRDKINNWIQRLSTIIPDPSHPDIKGNGHYDGQSKGAILAKACEYITELRENQEKLDICMQENKKLLETIEVLKQRNFALEQENKDCKEMLKRSGIDTVEIEMPNNNITS